MIKPIYQGATIIVTGTGPSITNESIELVNEARAAGLVKVFGSNRAYQIFDVDLMHGCNKEFWEYWYEHDPELKNRPFLKYTTRPELEGKYPGLEYIKEEWIDGLSRDPTYIAAHHGTGPQAVNLAYLFGAARILLIGWDMRFPGKVDNKTYKQPRRYFGEDALTKKHWPRTGADGALDGLINEMKTINPKDYGIEIINCTPGSAMRCFPMMDLSDALAA